MGASGYKGKSMAKFQITAMVAAAMVMMSAGAAFAQDVEQGNDVPVEWSEWAFDDNYGEAQEKPKAEAISSDEVYRRLVNLKSTELTEGTKWTDATCYENGYGCSAFTFLVQDRVFGDTASEVYTDFDWNRIKVGDHIRLDGHGVIVLTKGENSVTVAEGNFNSSVHWGRTFTREELQRRFLYQETRLF